MPKNTKSNTKKKTASKKTVSKAATSNAEVKKESNNIVTDPDLVAAIKKQVLEEMKDEKVRSMEQSRLAREEQKKAHAEYVEKMKASSEPWVDIVAWNESTEGVNVELEWNDAFVDFLKANGITGADEEQIVQKWITLLLHDMAADMEEKIEEDGGQFN